jgi:head-tail adaptor
MNIGQLNTPCRVEYPATTQEGEFGTPVVTWTVLSSMSWFNLQDVLPSRSEAVKGGLSLSAIQTRVRGRYRTDMSATMRIVALRNPEVVFNLITEPAVLGNKDGIEFMVERVSS